MNLAVAIREAIDRHELIPDGANVVVGVSGGADSVALAHALHELGIRFTVAHVNHNLRGAESDADERFVRALGFPVEVKSVDVRALAQESGQSLEMAARQARHGFFAEFENAVIALAHHADDQAETFLLRLARGAGCEGLGGMAFKQEIGPIRLIRPMLEIPRETILQWLEEKELSWREDASNADETFLRNKVRHTVLPLLEKELNPGIRNTILRTMEILRAENEWMTAMQDGSESLAARRRTLRMWLFDQGAEEVSFDCIEKILSLMDAAAGTTVFELNERQRVVVEYGEPRFETGLCRPESLPCVRLTMETGTGWRKDHGKGAGVLPAEASFDAEKVGGSPIEVRGWRPGDRMEPLGMAGSRKLQDILTDQKVPREQRAGVPVVVCRNEIIWLPGYRTARGWDVRGRDGKAVHLRIEQNGTE
ncbi:tRNA(Ile)-lysidine synthase [Pontiella desulfatans]|uniref:tRNA(Ile)-lysidine synthase n=1 Tax=Pontiella desulfatans TaxID=2750659 RepID=A0A6C2U9A7_PONDE|nr:tRNA lysidine(34) synthetase TilS [Pontiella desulfatans]VGO15966.1 tRNA(Ile)-lysidine synthase [Pontiella desulfatans]